MQQRLTRRQNQLFQFIADRLDASGESPTLAEMAGTMGVESLRTVTQYLEALERKGLIVRNRYVHRGIRIRKQADASTFVTVPVLASAGCGMPSVIAEQGFDEYATVSVDLLGDRMDDAYLIRAVGGSMQDDGISDGDLVLVEHTDQVKTGDRVVAIIDDNAVIKRITIGSDTIVLSPASSDPQYQPLIMRKDFQVFGKVLSVVPRMTPSEYQLVPIADSDGQELP